jgi:hypothetical protein
MNPNFPDGLLETMEATQQFGKLIREHIQFDADG